MKLSYFICSLFGIWCIFSACSTANSTKNTQQVPTINRKDTIIVSNASIYTGFRLQITDIEVIQRKKNSVKIRFNLINSGKRTILLNGMPERIAISFDESLEKNGLQSIQNQLIATVQQKTLYIEAGEMKKNFRETFKIAPDAVLSPTPKKETDPDNAPGSVNITYCPDMVIEKIDILKQTQKIVLLQYTLANIGKGPVSLYGKLNDDDDNIYVKAFCSTTEKLSRGAIPIGGAAITKGVAHPSGLLLPNQQYKHTMELDISQQTPKFTPYIVLEIDAYQKIWECDEKNNTTAAKMRQ
jgi:hypothetical protein